MAAELSSDLQAILKLLPKGWQLARLGPGRIRWVAELAFKKDRFQLVSDRGYIEVSKIVQGKTMSIPPPPDQRISISPQQVCNLLLQSAEE